MTQAAVSYQIKLLEERVGSPLFSRGARGVTLSETGRRLAPAVSEAFTQIRAAFEDLSETAEGVLRITALSTRQHTTHLPVEPIPPNAPDHQPRGGRDGDYEPEPDHETQCSSNDICETHDGLPRQQPAEHADRTR